MCTFLQLPPCSSPETLIPRQLLFHHFQHFVKEIVSRSRFRIFADFVFCNQHYLCLPCRDYRVIAPSALINERASHVQWHYFPFSRHLLGTLIIYDSFLISWFLYKSQNVHCDYLNFPNVPSQKRPICNKVPTIFFS